MRRIEAKARPIMDLPRQVLDPMKQVAKEVLPFADDFPEIKEFKATKRQVLDLAGTQKDLDKKLKAQAEQFTAVKRDVKKVAKRVEVVDEAVDLATDKVEDLKDVYDDLGNKVRKNTGNISTNKKAAAGATTTAAGAAASVSAVSVRLAALAGVVSSLITAGVLANELRRAINNMRNELRRESQYLTDLILLNQKRSINRDNQIRADLGTDIRGVSNKVTSLSSSVRTNTSAIATNKREIGTNNRTINRVWTETRTNTRNITQLGTNVSTNTRTITQTQNQVNTNTQAITGLKTGVQTNTRTITQTQTQTNTNTRTITTIQQQLKDVPKVIRVPQPYPVTRIRTVKVPQPYPVTKTVIKEVPTTRVVTRTKVQKVTERIPFIQTHRIERERVRVERVQIPGQNTTTKLSNSDLTKIGAATCSAVRACTPQNDDTKRLEELLGKPFATPETLANDGKDGTINHKSFASILSWWIYQMDSFVGEFPIKLEIEDSDLLKVGDQVEKIKIPNMAEALAELLGNSINNKAVTEATLDAQMRSLMEAGSGRKQAIVNHALLEAICDYLGFSIRQTIKSVPFTYNPIDAVKKDKISEALNASTQIVKVETNSDPDTLEKQLKALLEAARIIKAVHVRKLSPDNVEDWKAMMRASREQVKGEGGDFDAFLRNVEEGWTGATGNDPNEPYDRNHEERPKIRRLDVEKGGSNGST